MNENGLFRSTLTEDGKGLTDTINQLFTDGGEVTGFGYSPNRAVLGRLSDDGTQLQSIIARKPSASSLSDFYEITLSDGTSQVHRLRHSNGGITTTILVRRASNPGETYQKIEFDFNSNERQILWGLPIKNKVDKGVHTIMAAARIGNYSAPQKISQNQRGIIMTTSYFCSDPSLDGNTRLVASFFDGFGAISPYNNELVDNT